MEPALAPSFAPENPTAILATPNPNPTCPSIRANSGSLSSNTTEAISNPPATAASPVTAMAKAIELPPVNGAASTPATAIAIRNSLV
ncbi:hypothetical protein D3C86_1842010 [compost metagenome]